MKSIDIFIDELLDLQSRGVEYLEFVDTEWNNYDLKSIEQSGAKDFGYLILDSQVIEDCCE